MKKYDFLIVGAGLFGSVFAREMKERGKTCLVIDRRDHIGGNVYTKEVHGINVHVYGAHIFHTSNKEVWDYVNRFATFNDFVNSPIADFNGERYHLPFNMNTFTELWPDVRTAEDAKAKIQSQTCGYTPENAQNLEEKAISMVGRQMYEKLVKEYTEKQWGRPCNELPAFIISRLPLRFTFDNNYFNDVYQGVAVGGYTKMIENLLEGTEVLLNTPYDEFIKGHKGIANATVYTGAIDEYFGYTLGKLEYRTLKFETEELDMPDYQGNAVVNYTSKKVPYTRIIEHKHFEFGKQKTTIITKEYPHDYEDGMEKFYPVNNARNNELYAKYKELAEKEDNVFFCGRLGAYGYFDMDKTVLNALEFAKKFDR